MSSGWLNLLILYIGASLICIDNKHMKDRVPRGNGTLCRVLGVKVKENAPNHRVKNYYGKKEWRVNNSQFVIKFTYII